MIDSFLSNINWENNYLSEICVVEAITIYFVGYIDQALCRGCGSFLEAKWRLYLRPEQEFILPPRTHRVSKEISMKLTGVLDQIKRPECTKELTKIIAASQGFVRSKVLMRKCFIVY